MQRNTIQRQITLDTLQTFSTHPTVDELYAEIKKSHPAISKTTIYRNLRQLVQSSQVGKVGLPNDAERFDKRTDPHCHFQCKSCGALYDVDIDYPENLNEKVEEKYDFQVDGYGIIFEGICQQCKKK